MNTATAEPRTGTGISLFTNTSTQNQALIMFDLTDPFIAEMVEDILDVAEAMERKRNDTGVRRPLAEIEAKLLQK